MATPTPVAPSQPRQPAASRLKPGDRYLISYPMWPTVIAFEIENDGKRIARRRLDKLDKPGFERIWTEGLPPGYRGIISKSEDPKIRAFEVRKDGEGSKYRLLEYLDKSSFDRIWNDESVGTGHYQGEDFTVAASTDSYVSIFGDGLGRVEEAQEDSKG